MATYKTGRTRTLTWSGSITGSFQNYVLDLFGFTFFGANCELFIGGGPYAKNYMWYIRVYTTISSEGPLIKYANLDITFADSSTYWSTAFGPYPNGYNENLPIDGNYSVSVEVEEMVTTSFPGYNPSNIGTQKVDPPEPLDLVFWERIIIGSNINISCDATNVSGSISVPITVDNQFDLSELGTYAVFLQAWCSGGHSIFVPAGLPGFASIQSLLAGAPLGIASYSGSDSNHTWNASGGVNVTAGIDGTAGFTQLDTLCSPPQQVTMNGIVRAMLSAYPADLKVLTYLYAGSTGNLVDCPSGGWSDTYMQQSYGAGHQLDSEYSYGLTFDIEYDDLSSVNAAIQAASLTANNEDATLTRLLCRGFSWDAMTMTQAESMNVDNAPQTDNWTAGTNTTLANSGSDAITATVSGGPGSFASTLPIADAALTNANWLGVSFCGYRFLRVMLTGDDDDTNQPASIVIGSKEWDFTVGTSGYVDIDLCCPTNRTSTTDTDDSQWTWNGPAPYSVTDGEAWGVSNVSTFTIKNLANGHEYTLAGIQLVRNDHTGMTFLPTYKGWLQAFPSVMIGDVTSTTYYRRGRQADTDGRQSREDTDAVWIHTDGEVSTDTYSEVAISAVVAGLHTGGVPPRDGWDATDLMPNPNVATPGTCTGDGSDPVFNCYLNSDQSSCYLFGSGAMYDGSRWNFGFDIGCTGTATIPAQVLFDNITFYPQCGDIFQLSGGAYGGGANLFMAAILRGAAYGLIMNSNDESVPDVLVDVKDTATGLIDAGSGYSSSVGEYKTGAPYGIGLVSYTITAESGSLPYPTLTGTFFSRHRSRFCFPGVHQPICCDIIFCPNDFLFPFTPFTGDHTILPLDDYEQIPDVTALVST